MFFPFWKACSSSKFPDVLLPTMWASARRDGRDVRVICCPDSTRRQTPCTHASRDFFHPPPPCEWRHRYLISLFIFSVFPLRSISVVIFFVFQFFFFYLLYVWSFFDNFYMEMILKNYTKTCDYKLHDKFVRTKVVWEIFQITSSYNLCWKVILYKLF